jgi:cytochrome c
MVLEYERIETNVAKLYYNKTAISRYWSYFATEGESIYKESDCSLCHGEMGDGVDISSGGNTQLELTLP